MHKFTRTLTYLAFSIFPVLSAHAANTTDFLGIPGAQPYVGFNLGSTSVQADGTNQTQLPHVANPDNFATSSTQQTLQYGIVAGVNIPRADAASPWFSAYQVEMSLWQQGNVTVNGVHNLNSPPVFNNVNFDYQYSLQVRALSLDGAVTVYQWQQWSPFVGLGVDMGQAMSSDYTDNSGATFSNNTSSLFMYHLRMGVRYSLPKQWQAQVAYTYYPAVNISTGAGTTGYAALSSLQNTISMSNVGITLSYQF